MISDVLLFEPKKDPDVERALEKTGVHLRCTRKIDEALKLVSSLTIRILIIDTRGSQLDSLRTVATFWDRVKDRPQPPSLIFLDTNVVSELNVSGFGPVRFSDRQHLSEVFTEVLTASRHGSTDDQEPESSWKTVRDRMWTRGNDRFKVEQARMQKLGIVDERGQAATKGWPADMKPESRTDVGT